MLVLEIMELKEEKRLKKDIRMLRVERDELLGIFSFFYKCIITRYK